MARKLQRREWTLVGVLVVVVIAMYYLTGSAGRDGAGAGKAEEAKKGAQRDDAPVVRMDLLGHKEVAPKEERNLFMYEPRPPTRKELARQEAERRRLAKLAEEERKRQEAAALEQARIAALRAAEEAKLPKPPPPPPPPPAIPFKYIGLLGPKENKICVFEEGREILVARVGEVLKDQFRILDVKHDAVVIGYVRKEFQSQSKELTMQRR